MISDPRLDRLTPAQRQLLLSRLGTDRPAAGDSAPPRAAAANPDDAALSQLSFAQERLWLQQQIEPESRAFSTRHVVRLTGPLQPRVLRSAMRATIARHASLRACFPSIDGQPMQRVLTADTFAGGVADLQSLPAAVREAEALRLARAESLRAFSLEEGPLFRACLIRLAPEEHVLVLTLHHIVADGVSLTIFQRELADGYNAGRRGEPVAIEPPRLAYADYAAWERQRVERIAEAELGFWRARLAGRPPLELPLDRPRPARRSGRAGVERIDIAPDVHGALRRLSGDAGASPFMLHLALAGILLARLSAQRHVTITTVVQNRLHPGAAAVIGFFSNMLPIAFEVEPRRTVRAHLAAVRDACLRTYAHQELPFERIVDAIGPPRDAGSRPVWLRVMLTWQAAASELQLDEVTATPFLREPLGARFDLAFGLSESSETLAGTLAYDEDLYEPASIRRMARQWRRIAAAAARDPEARVCDLPLLTDEERREILYARNATWTGEPIPTAIALFEAAAARHAASVAIECGERCTYAQVRQQAHRFAHALRRAGVHPGDRVGLLMDRSPGMVVAMLGVMISGGAYVPLDPDHPAPRLALVIEDAALALLVTARDLMPRLAGLGDAAPRILTIGALTGAGHEEANEETREEPFDWTFEDARRPVGSMAAYVLYTSGSTGRPKGVVVSHEALANCLIAFQGLLGVTPADRVLALTTWTFDIAVLELLLPLIAGARAIVAPPGVPGNARRLGELWRDAGITIAQATPSGWRLLLETCAPSPGQTLLCGGEALPDDLAARLVASGARVLNVYGPTETTVWSTQHPVTRARGGPPIGRPIANTGVFVLDGEMHPVPDGVSGDLFIGGAGVAHGYWRRPALTAERFVPHPFAGQPGLRLYCTGDRARWNAGGELEFLGRADQQIKLRGFRIELGEIEQALRRCPGVRASAASIDESSGADRRLIGYVVIEPETAVDDRAIRARLHATLPPYMVPEVFVRLEALPMTPNGKLDRAALPPPPSAAARDAVADGAPLTEVEQTLARIWGELLGLDDDHAAERQDGFFERGGNSLKGMQLVARVRARIGVELPLAVIFEAPTLEALAARIEAARAGLTEPPPSASTQLDDAAEAEVGAEAVADAGAEAGNIAATDSAAAFELPLMPEQERLWLREQLAPRSPVYTLAGTIAIDGPLDVAGLEQSLRDLVARHDALRAAFVQRHGAPVQVIRAEVPSPLVIEPCEGETAAARAAAITRRVAEEARRPFDLAAGPLFRARLWRVDEARHVLSCTVHHLVADGWSIAIILRDLARGYEAHVTGHASPPSRPHVSYAGAVRASRADDCGRRARGAAYWDGRLRAPLPVLDLPGDRPRPAQPAFDGETAPIVPPDACALAAGIEALAAHARVTPFVILLAALQALCARYTGGTDILIGAPLANRPHAALEDVVGCFAALAPLRTDLSGNPSGDELLRRVQETCLGAHAHPEVPGHHAALPWRVVLTLHNQPRVPVALHGLRLTPIDLSRRTAKFDINVNVTLEHGGFAGGVEYSRDRFDAVTGARFAQHYARMLASLVRDPATHLDALEFLAPDEQRGLRASRPRTALDEPMLLG